MKFNQQQHTLITEIYDYNTNIWTLNIQNDILGLNEALQKIRIQKKKIKLGIKENEYFTKKQEYLQLIINFITHNYITKNDSYITAEDLRKQFLEYYLNVAISAKKFGMFMTEIINTPEINTLSIQRKKGRTGNVYVGIKSII